MSENHEEEQLKKIALSVSQADQVERDQTYELLREVAELKRVLSSEQHRLNVYRKSEALLQATVAACDVIATAQGREAIDAAVRAMGQHVTSTVLAVRDLALRALAFKEMPIKR
jgi:tellurite resistance protein